MLYINKQKQKAWLRKNTPLDLSVREFNLLILLAENNERWISKTEILEQIWGTAYKSDSVVTQLVSSLRQKLDDHNGKNFIATVHGQG